MIPSEMDPEGLTTRDLLQSLQRSILRLRQEAEELQQQLVVNGSEALTTAPPKIAKLEGLIRDCQKVEKTLVEQNNQSTGSGGGLDLERARIEISSRLDRLRTTYNTGEPDAGVE